MKKLILFMVLFMIVSTFPANAGVDLSQCEKVGNNNPVCIGEVIKNEVKKVVKQTEKDVIVSFFEKFVNMVLKSNEKENDVIIKSYFEDDNVIVYESQKVETNGSILIKDRQSDSEVNCWKENNEVICGYGE